MTSDFSSELVPAFGVLVPAFGVLVPAFGVLVPAFGVLVSVVVPNLNSPMIDCTIASLKAQNYRGEIEIIVVGMDEPRLIQPDEQVRFISTPHPVGPATARNLGIDAARGEYIFFIDADCLAAEDWVGVVMARHREGHEVVGGAVTFPTDHYWAVCDNVAAFRRYLPITPAGKRRYLPTLNFSARRDLLLQVGKFDESFTKPAGEDIDISLKLAALGHPPYFEPRAVVHHLHNRFAPLATWRRFVSFGEAWVQIRSTHPQWKAFNRLFALFRQAPLLFLLLSPFAVLYNTAHDFGTNPALIRRYWYTLPAFLWSNAAWAWGVYRALVHHLKGNSEAYKPLAPCVVPTTTPRVAIVILTWNTRAETLACLQSVCQLDYPRYEVIVVDNASNDGTADAVRAEFPQTTLLVNAANLGYAGGNNVGMRHALAQSFDYVLLLNNDTIVDSALLTELVNVAETDEHIGVTVPKIYYHNEPTRLWYAGATHHPIRLTAQTIGLDEVDVGQYDTPRYVSRAYGCAILIKRAVLEQIGLLDEDFFAYHEDDDFSIRVQRAGYDIVYTPTARLWHKVSASTRHISAVQVYYRARNRLLLYWKHLRGAQRWRAWALEVPHIARLTWKWRRAGQLSQLRVHLRGLWDGMMKVTGERR